MSIKDGKRGLLSSVNHSLNKSLEDRKTQPHFIVQSLIHTHTHNHRKWHFGHKTGWECTDITSDYVSFSLLCLAVGTKSHTLR